MSDHWKTREGYVKDALSKGKTEPIDGCKYIRATFDVTMNTEEFSKHRDRIDAKVATFTNHKPATPLEKREHAAAGSEALGRMTPERAAEAVPEDQRVKEVKMGRVELARLIQRLVRQFGGETVRDTVEIVEALEKPE